MVVLIAIRFLVLTADEYLAPNMGKIADSLHMSHNMAGVTFLAFANSAPDFFASYVALTGDNESLGVGISWETPCSLLFLLRGSCRTFAQVCEGKSCRVFHTTDTNTLFNDQAKRV